MRVHVVAPCDAVPVHGLGVIEGVVDGHGELVADVGADQRAGNLVVIASVGARVPPKSMSACPGVGRTVTVRPVCGRDFSSATIAFDRLGVAPGLVACGVVGRPHAANAALPMRLAVRKPRRVIGADVMRCVLTSAFPGSQSALRARGV